MMETFRLRNFQHVWMRIAHDGNRVNELAHLSLFLLFERDETRGKLTHRSNVRPCFDFSKIKCLNFLSKFA